MRKCLVCLTYGLRMARVMTLGLARAGRARICGWLRTWVRRAFGLGVSLAIRCRWADWLLAGFEYFWQKEALGLGRGGWAVICGWLGLERSLGCGAALGWVPVEYFYKAERVGRARGRLGAVVGSAFCWLALRWRVAGVALWRCGGTVLLGAGRGGGALRLARRAVLAGDCGVVSALRGVGACGELSAVVKPCVRACPNAAPDPPPRAGAFAPSLGYGR